ncbi:MAG: helicase HerA-like domain-containing protein [Candidatus Sedimenticola sp. 20ELBAFRAG]
MGGGSNFTIGGSDGVGIPQLGKMSNRHGMIAGATGTGKTVTLQILAEGFSRMGVPVFAADIKGDLSGLAAASSGKDFSSRLQAIGIDDHKEIASPVLFWDLFGDNGHPVRTTISEMGPLLLGSLLELNETQEGLLYAAFRIADDEGMLMLDIKDLRAMLNWMGDNAKELRNEYGNISSASIGAIQRRLLVLEEQGAEHFFGEPALELRDLMQTDFSGNGVISLLDATRLASESPRLYTAFLLWILSELFEQLPEQGDADKPKMVFFFDEAHLLFEQANKPLLEKIEQVVRLIRSKGVGIFFISQKPTDIPEDVLGQLGLKVQHALRAFTPKDRKAIKAVAQNFRSNPGLDVEETITQLGIGEALVSVLDEKGRPTPVSRALIRPPQSRIGPLADDERNDRISRSPIGTRYDKALDRESAYELLKKRAEKEAEAEAEATEKAAREKAKSKKSGGSRRQSVGEAFIKSAARSIGSQLGRKIIRGVLGSIFGGRS